VQTEQQSRRRGVSAGKQGRRENYSVHAMCAVTIGGETKSLVKWRGEKEEGYMQQGGLGRE
jgi:hypothetical protein